MASPLDFLGRLLMAAPKKRTSLHKRRIRAAGQVANRGPKLKKDIYLCPVCERFAQPHRVCEREDCKPNFRARFAPPQQPEPLSTPSAPSRPCLAPAAD